MTRAAAAGPAVRPVAGADVLELAAVTKPGRGDLRPRLDRVSLTVAPASVHGLVGANGAGKSTLLRLVAGLSRPTAGTVRVLHHDPWTSTELGLQQMATALDPPLLDGRLSPRRAVAHLVAGHRLELEPADLVRSAGLSVTERRPLARHSSGQQVRLRLALVDALASPLVVLDEPFNALDPPAMRWLRGRLAAWRTAGRAILISSHRLTELAELCDRVSILDRGRLVISAATRDLLADRGGAVVEVELDAGQQDAAVAALSRQFGRVHATERGVRVASGRPAEVARCLAEVGVWPSRLGQVRPDLEQIYHDLVTGAEASDREPSGGDHRAR